MTNCCGNVGALSKLAIGATGGTPTRLDFISVHNTTVKTLSDGSSQTIRGTLDPVVNNVGEGMLHIRFRTAMWLTAQKFDIVLPRLGFTESPADTWTLHDSITLSKIIVGPGGSDEITYDECCPTDWFVMGRKGTDPILLDIGWVGKTRTPHTEGTFFTGQWTPPMTEGWVYPFPDGSSNLTEFDLFGNTYNFPMFKLGLDYGTIIEYNNSVNATHICPTQHVVTFGASALYSTCDDTEDLLEVPMTGDVDGGAVTIDLERTVGAATYRTIFNVNNMKLIARDPSITKKDWIRLPIQARGHTEGSEPLLVITNDAT